MKFLTLIKKLASYWKIISAVIAIAGVLIAGKVKYDSYIISQAENKRIETERWRKVDTALFNIKQIKFDISSIKKNDEGKAVIDEKQTQSLQALDRSYTGLLKQTGKIDILIQYMEDLKKNE